jgi:hypothetical protein
VSAKEARAVDDARLWLLLETIGQAAVGLRRELASTHRPAAGRLRGRRRRRPPGGVSRPGPARSDADDPAGSTSLLALPKAHMLVDGYNVTKTGYGELSLEQQRSRLITGWAASPRRPAPRSPSSSTAPSGSSACHRRRAACGCSSRRRARPPTT